MKNILIPIENNSEEYTTIDEAVELAKKFDSKITLLNVDNTKKELGKINDRRFMNDGRMGSSLGDSRLPDENSLPGAAAKGNTKYYGKENLKERYLKQEKINKTNFLKFIEELYHLEGIETDTILAEGDPASAILDEVEKGNYDLVIMETHIMKERKRFMLGSVTNKIVHHINIPILIIR